MKLTSGKLLTRRDMIKGSMAAAALALTQYPLSLFGGPEAEEGGVLIPFLDLQPEGKHQTQWAELTDWYTKKEDLYVVQHYNTPSPKAEDYELEISGLVRSPKKFSIAQLKRRKKKTVTARAFQLNMKSAAIAPAWNKTITDKVPQLRFLRCGRIISDPDPATARRGTVSSM